MGVAPGLEDGAVEADQDQPPEETIGAVAVVSGHLIAGKQKAGRYQHL